jgi:putative glutathione S-transferase
MHAIPGIAETVDLAQIKRHYYGSQRWVNPTGIIPLGPAVDLGTP